jgi:hypothetical protein
MISPKEDDAPPSAATADDDTLSCKRPRGEEAEEKTKRTRVDALVAAEEAKATSLNENIKNNDEDDDDDDNNNNNRSGGTALIRGLPSRWDERRFRLALHEMRVTGHTKVKKRTGWTHAFVTFNFPKERDYCLKSYRNERSSKERRRRRKRRRKERAVLLLLAER